MQFVHRSVVQCHFESVNSDNYFLGTVTSPHYSFKKSPDNIIVITLVHIRKTF